MIIKMRPGATERQIRDVIEAVKSAGYAASIDKGTYTAVIGVRGNTRGLEEERFMLPGVEDVIRVTTPYKEAGREFHPADTVVKISDNVYVGGEHRMVIAGPCAVEGRDMLLRTAEAVKEAGADALRGGAWKPRTSPYSFQGLKEEALEYLREASEEFGLPVVVEIVDLEHLDRYEGYDIDVLQVGARNMDNYHLLENLGERTTKPVLLKRGMSATYEEWLLAAEYVLLGGNPVILCERGIRAFGNGETRNTFDINAFSVIRKLSHLPVIGDPSHATGSREYIPSMSKAAMGAGAHGLIIEVHPDPQNAKCDANQQLNFKEFKELMKELRENNYIS